MSTVTSDVTAIPGPQRVGNRKAAGQDPAKRAQILAGAKRCFMRLGYEAASMNEITAEAGVSKGTIYVYFADKQALFRALVESEKSAAMEALRRDLARTASVEEALTVFGRTCCFRLCCDDGVKAQRMVIGVIESMPEVGGIFYGMDSSAGPGILSEYLEQKVREGVLDIPDINLAAQQFTDLAMSGLYRPRLFGSLCHAPDREGIDYVVKSAVAIFLARYGRKSA